MDLYLSFVNWLNYCSFLPKFWSVSFLEIKDRSTCDHFLGNWKFNGVSKSFHSTVAVITTDRCGFLSKVFILGDVSAHNMNKSYAEMHILCHDRHLLTDLRGQLCTMRESMSASVLQSLKGPSVKSLPVSFRSETELKKQNSWPQVSLVYWLLSTKIRPSLFSWVKLTLK